MCGLEVIGKRRAPVTGGCPTNGCEPAVAGGCGQAIGLGAESESDQSEFLVQR